VPHHATPITHFCLHLCIFIPLRFKCM